MFEDDAAASNRLGQPAPVAGDDGNAAELSLGDDTAPGLVLPLAGDQEYPRLAVDRSHIVRSLAQHDVAQPPQFAAQGGFLFEPERPAANESKGDVRAQRGDLQRRSWCNVSPGGFGGYRVFLLLIFRACALLSRLLVKT